MYKKYISNNPHSAYTSENERGGGRRKARGARICAYAYAQAHAAHMHKPYFPREPYRSLGYDAIAATISAAAKAKGPEARISLSFLVGVFFRSKEAYIVSPKREP